MAKLMYLMHTSLDGYIEDEQGKFDWTVPSAAVNGYINEVSSSIGTCLYGRRMYEAMVFWDEAYKAHNFPPFLLDWATWWQAADKIVYSRTLTEPSSARTRIEREFNPDGVRQLKQDAVHDISINGSELAGHALRAGLVDEILMLVCPVMVGNGKRFFPDDVRANLELIDEHAFPNGVLAVRYAVRS